MKLIATDPARETRILLYQFRAALRLGLFAGDRQDPDEPRVRGHFHCVHCGFSTPMIRDDPPPGWRTIIVYTGSDPIDECPLCAAAWDEAHGAALLVRHQRAAKRLSDPETARRKVA